MTPGQQKAIEKATEQTDENFKTESLYTLAKTFGTKQHREIFKHVSALQIAFTHMPDELNTLREQWAQHFYNHVESKFGHAIKEQVRMCG